MLGQNRIATPSSAVTRASPGNALFFDPDNPDSLAAAARVVRNFVTIEGRTDDQVRLLRGAAACAALVREEGSYRAAMERTGEPVTLTFLRKWARVHDLPISIRRHIALGDISPSAAMHLARVTGPARFLLAWAVMDHDLTVEEVRQVGSLVPDGHSVEHALARYDVPLGEMMLTLSVSTYQEFRRIAAQERLSPSELVSEMLALWQSKRSP